METWMAAPVYRLVNMLPKPIQSRIERRISEKTAKLRMEIQQGNWRMVQRFEELKALLNDPHLTEEDREEFRKEIAGLGEKVDAFQEEKTRLDREMEAR